MTLCKTLENLVRRKLRQKGTTDGKQEKCDDIRRTGNKVRMAKIVMLTEQQKMELSNVIKENGMMITMEEEI